MDILGHIAYCNCGKALVPTPIGYYCDNSNCDQEYGIDIERTPGKEQVAEMFLESFGEPEYDMDCVVTALKGCFEKLQYHKDESVNLHTQLVNQGEELDKLRDFKNSVFYKMYCFWKGWIW